MKIVGITGTFGSGKSEAARMFSELGAYLVDHDKISHEILLKGRPGYDALLAEYGKGILGTDGEIARSKVAEIAFSSIESVRRIEYILHPIIINAEKETVERFKAEQKHDFIVFDTPLLFEAQRNEVCDYTVVITADEDTCYKRIEKKFGMTKSEAKRRTSYQMSLEEKTTLADFVIDNNGTADELKEKIRALFEQIKGGQ